MPIPVRFRCLTALLFVAALAAPVVATEWAMIEIENGEKAQLRVEIAATRAERVKGLSGRKEPLAADGGMLFVFNPPNTVCMWMKDTPIPLAAAFIRGDGRVIKTAAMRPLTTRRHCSETEVTYVLEASPQLLNSVLAVGATVRVSVTQ